MKNIFLSILTVFSFHAVFAQNAGIGTTTPNSNAKLDVVSTTKGTLMPRLDQTQANALAGNLDGSDNGMIIFNTSQNCLQIWKEDVFECVFITSGQEIGNAGAVKVNVRAALPPNVTAEDAANAGDDTHPGYLSWGNPFFFFGFLIWPEEGDVLPLDFDPADLVLSAFPTTTWPESEVDQTITGIYTNDQAFTSETADAWKENDSKGQVHFWRVIIFAQHNNQGAYEGNLTVTLRNPESGFSTSSTQFAPAQTGVFPLTFQFITIADDISLPSGSGFGYVLEVTASQPTLVEAWVDSITRTSLIND